MNQQLGVCVFFFFQAEDGIRDYKVTGVQTCALPISGRDTLEALYDFVSKNYRYVSLSFGVGRYQPHAAGEVLANQYGDCKDKHTLLASLLAAVGRRAYPALISTGAEIDSDVPSPLQFDHMISAVPEGDAFIWLDTTPGVSPFGFLLYGLRAKQ